MFDGIADPVLAVLFFLPRNFLDFWHFLPRSWQFFLARFARICKIFQDRGKKFWKILGVLGNKARLTKILERETRKACIKVIQDLNISYKQFENSFENSKRELLLRVLLSEAQLGLAKKNEAKIHWNKMEAKIKHIGMKIMVQTFFVEMCDFFWSFSGIQMKRFCIRRSLVQASSTEYNKHRSNKNCILRILLPQKSNWGFSHVFLRSKDASNHWNKKTNR